MYFWYSLLFREQAQVNAHLSSCREGMASKILFRKKKCDMGLRKSIFRYIAHTHPIKAETRAIEFRLKNCPSGSKNTVALAVQVMVWN